MNQKNWIDKWNHNFQNKEYVYGKLPNVFLKEQLDLLPAQNILFAAEGEGRNAVYAAQKGWQVTAFDISEEGRKKAFQLANEAAVSIDYQVGELLNLDFSDQKFEVLALIYAHFPAEIKSDYHQRLARLVSENGIVIFEAFSKKHLPYREKNPKVGGPADEASLFSIEELKADFSDFEFLYLEEREIELSEGLFHNGKGSVIRFVAKKK
ncbi:class I SAM-dependent methyltransferase [Capnocytophaga catalasegens]|uniref:Methyltransferase n=1 Tax=Capnocytophaga catalasegens TaxID=1004260 RepID=A0AAV5ASU8_9FLAO|nr:class I SAM-dependent methyltransferase [Capnocytophaga catalasegens]GIZ14186.1 methyltransferase [Capnocytophaga catalasegens]GJM50366.1 methyltransferase [Capnocytophaga catalasegens]GJM52648.1 methyltransferase [Capnocytophaga catalasegens]